MAGTEQIVLYDIPSKAPRKCWSLNPWKTRFVLNFKNLDYRTEWVEYPDIRPILENHLPPNPDGSGFPYSSPAARLSDGTYLMDSKVIAKELEKRHPLPSLQLDAPQLAKLEGILPDIMTTIVGEYVPLVPKRILGEASLPYWYKTREERVGMPLDEFHVKRGGQAAWDNAKPHIDKVSAMLKEDDSGPFFLGSKVSYVDFVWGGFLIFMQRIGSDVWERFMKAVGNEGVVHGKLLLALDEWSLRSDR